MKTDLKYRMEQRLTYDDYDANLRRQMYWSGKWAAGTYEPNEVVEHKGGVWICVNETTTEPGTAAGLTDWDLLGGQIREVWQATPIVGMTSQTIQWTFVPLFTGQTPSLVSEASGVFTFLTNGAGIEIEENVHVSFEYAANNSEASYSISPVYSGTGISTLLPMLDADQSSQSGSFGRTGYQKGNILAALNDTLSFLADSTGTNLSDVDLVAMYLQFYGPPPND